MDFLEYIQEDPDASEEKTSPSISDIPFIPNLCGDTPIHDSMEQNNTSVTDQLLLSLKDASFDHHCRYLLHMYHELLEAVP